MICRRNMGEDNFRVGEMFAGVGGVRLGLEGPPSKIGRLSFSNSKRLDSRLYGATSGNRVAASSGHLLSTQNDSEKRDMMEMICTTSPRVSKPLTRSHILIYWLADSPAKTILLLARYLESWVFMERRENYGRLFGK